jgi:hypothetical protein
MTLGFMIIVVTFFFPAVAAELALILEIGSYQWRLLPPVRKKKKTFFSLQFEFDNSFVVCQFTAIFKPLN